MIYFILLICIWTLYFFFTNDYIVLFNKERKELSEDGMKLENLLHLHKNNYTLVLTAVKNNGLALKFASLRLQKKRKIYITALKNSGLALQYLSDEIKSNPKIVAFASQNNLQALEFSNFNKDLEFTKKILKLNPLALKKLNDNLKNDERFLSQLLILLPNYKGEIESLIANMKSKNKENEDLKNKEKVLEEVKKDGFNLAYFPDFQDDFDVVYFAVKNKGSAISYASTRLCDNELIVESALSSNQNMFSYASDRLKNDKNFILKNIEKSPNMYNHIGKNLLCDVNFLLEVKKVAWYLDEKIDSDIKKLTT